MEGTTSTSNEGSKKRDLSQYKQANVKNVSEKSLNKDLKLKGFEDLDIVCAIAFDVKENVKGLNSTSSAVSSSSADSKKIDLDEIRESGVAISKIHNYTQELKPKIDKKRAAAKKKREEEKEAREAEEAKEAEEARKSREENKADQTPKSLDDSDIENMFE